MPSRRLQKLPHEKLQVVVTELQNGVSPRKIARLIQEEMGELREVPRSELITDIERYNRNLLTRENGDAIEANGHDTECALERGDDGLRVAQESSFDSTRPVGVEEFITSEHFLNKKKEIYPEVMKHLVELNSGKYVEAVLTGGIGSGKTTIALYTNAYQLYLLSCMRNPHEAFGLDPSSEILFIFQSKNKELAKSVDYQRFRSLIKDSPYFREKFPFDKGIRQRLVFPNGIQVVPVGGTDTAAIGQNVIGGLIDELNYMAVVEKSKLAVDNGMHDQAVAAYNSIARRRKSRFLNRGRLPGILCLVSSKKYPGQFTDQKEEEAKADPTIYVYDKRVWEIKPDSYAGGGWFPVFIGDMTRKPRILLENEDVSDADRHLVMSIPNIYLEDFRRDIINALREIAGVSTLARHPFIMEVDKVAKAFGKHPSVFSRPTVDFRDTGLSLRKKAFYKPELPRFVHIDLAISGDSAGLVVGTVTGFTDVRKMLGSLQSIAPGQEVYMPQIRIDGVLEIRPPKNSEILFWKIREVLFALRNMGMNLRWVTFDQFQSTDSQQILRQQGFITGQQSIDDVPCIPYDFTKAAFYEGRLELPEHPHLQMELVRLEKDAKTGKIDHLPNGSKDCADALAGVVYGLTMRREIWGLYGVSVMQAPPSLHAIVDKLRSNDDEHGR